MDAQEMAAASLESINRWMDSVSGEGWKWFVKRLSGNDSGATESHQEGILIPKSVAFDICPTLTQSSAPNPKAAISAEIMPAGERRELHLTYYRAAKDEARITRWNRPSRILHPELTGGLVVMAFYGELGHDKQEGRFWFCQNVVEEEAVEERVGVIEPGKWILLSPAEYFALEPEPHKGCALTESEIPAEWRTAFPSPQTLIERALAMAPSTSESVDKVLLDRRECETQLFYSVEQALIMPRLREGFTTVDDFIAYANSVTNRRKSRAGMSLELQLEAIFREQRLPNDRGKVSEGNKRPDFLFPSADAYHDGAWPEAKLRMLAAKTTCKDRWRQILNEADRIKPNKHLITLQEGVSRAQYEEMEKAGVVLIVPQPLHEKYPQAVRPHLISLDQFIAETRAACSP